MMSVNMTGWVLTVTWGRCAWKTPSMHLGNGLKDRRLMLCVLQQTKLLQYTCGHLAPDWRQTEMCFHIKRLQGFRLSRFLTDLHGVSRLSPVTFTAAKVTRGLRDRETKTLHKNMQTLWLKYLKERTLTASESSSSSHKRSAARGFPTTLSSAISP